MRKSAGFRFFVVGILVLLMFIPLFFVGEIIDSRADYNRQTIWDVGNEWGGAQTVSGPLLVIPVEGPVEREVEREVTDPNTGWTRKQTVTEVVTVRKPAIYVLPEDIAVDVATEAEERKRGIFRVPVYTSRVGMEFSLAVDALTDHVEPDETVLWDQAVLQVGLSSNSVLRGETALTVGGEPVQFEPRIDGAQGIFARVGDPREMGDVVMSLGLNGTQQFLLTPVGRTTNVNFDSDWPHPSFTGAYLPDGSEISENGFSAQWTIPYLARAVPHVARRDYTQELNNLAFGVKFFQPNDFYQKAYRAARYGILFIGLTFLTVFLLDGRSKVPAHPVHYILIGLAQSIFVLLMVAYAEQIGFGLAYLVSSVATVGLLTVFGAVGLKMGRGSLILGLMLSVLYGVLYLILQSTDFALLAGATLSFLALAGTMWATRNEEWYGPERPKRRWFSAPQPPAEPQAAN